MAIPFLFISFFDRKRAIVLCLRCNQNAAEIVSAAQSFHIFIMVQMSIDVTVSLTSMR